MNIYQQIQNKIEAISETAVKTWDEGLSQKALSTLNGVHLEAELYRLGFTSSPSIFKGGKNVDEAEILRARMVRYFGRRVMYQKEINNLCTKYNLTTHVAPRFKDVIPTENQIDIYRFTLELKEKGWNNGRVETDLYHIPITDEFYITAPPAMFREAANVKEMTKEEYQKWLEEDPIVWKRIWRFDPTVQKYDVRNKPTSMYVMVTAWGIEATLVNTN